MPPDLRISVCPSLLRPGYTTFCPAARRQLFGGKNVSPVLPYASATAAEVKPLLRENRNRMSISGAQFKVSMVQDKNLIRLASAGEPGQFILKPINRGEDYDNLDQLPANEHLTMQIAAQVYKIETAKNGLVFFGDGEPAYLTRRFDYDAAGHKVAQEDFASLLGKTEANAGNNFRFEGTYLDIANAIKKYVKPGEIECERLLERVVFNFVFSNGDAHLKNFSLRKAETGGYLLAPMYDALNTHLHIPGEKGYFALELYPDFYLQAPSIATLGYPCRSDFETLGRKMGLKDSRIQRLMAKYIAPQPEIYTLVSRSFLNPETKALYISAYEGRLKMMQQQARG